MTQGTTTAYDEIRYPTYVHGQLHPDRLGTTGYLLGLETAPAERCRYLELGCGDGGTLVALATALPGSEFVGIDLAPTAVERANETIAAVGLDNAVVRCADVTDLPPDLGTFDYVVSHGVLSWVPEPARHGILDACSRLLAPDGVAYVSYNAHPAGHLREITRQMLRYHLRGRRLSPAEALDEATNFIGFLTTTRPEGDLWRELMEGELAHLRDRNPAGIVHDELAEINEQLWFHEFVDMARSHDLQFLAEGDDLGYQSIMWPEHVRQLLDVLADDPVEREQYYDFVIARRFRQTTLCHAGATLVRPVDPARLAGVAVSGVIRPAQPVDLSPGVHVTFEAHGGVRPGSDLPLGKAALVLLGHHHPVPLPFPDLLAEARRLVAGVRDGEGDEDEDAGTLAKFLLHMHGGRAVSFHRHLPWWPHEPGERPVSSPLVRFQLGHGLSTVSSLRAFAVAVDEPARAVLALCDGTRDRLDLLSDLAAAGMPADPSSLSANLSRLGWLGLFTA